MHPDTLDINAVLLGRSRESGVERCIRGLLEALAVHGRLRYRVYSAPGIGLTHLAGERFSIETIRFPVRSRFLRIVWEQTLLPLTLRRRLPALLHAPGYISPLAAPSPVVLTVYDLVALRFPQWAARANAWHYRCLMPSVIRRAAAIVTPSATVRDDVIQRFRLPGSRVHVIAPAVAPLFCDPTPDTQTDAVRRRYGLPPRFMLYVGNIEPKKNTEGLLNAYARLCQVERDTPPLVMVGKLAWKSQGFVQRRRELGLVSRVPCLGALHDDDLRVVYRLATLLLMPSWYEGFGLPPLEAMACGTPVIVSTGGALPETVGDAAVCIEPGNEAAWTQAMREMLNDAGRRACMTERGLAHVKRYSASAVAEQHETLYCKIMGSNL